MAKEEKVEVVDLPPELDPNYDYRAELEKLTRRTRRGRRWIGVVSLILTSIIIISYLGYLVAQEQASAASIRLTNRSKEISLAKIGFRTERALTSVEQTQHNLVADEENEFLEKKIYWTTNRVSQATLRFIVSVSGFPEGLSLSPITTRDYKRGDPITLYNSYGGLERYNRHLVQDKVADHYNYFGFNMLFQIELKNDADLAGYPFYFEPDSKFSGYNAIDEAIRLGFDSNETSDIIRPIAYTGGVTEGSIDVGGRFDFEKRQLGDTEAYYDYTDINIRDKRYEIAFGDFEEDLSDDPAADTFWLSNPAVTNSDPGPKTAPGVYALDTSKVTPKKAYYKNSFRFYSYVNKVGSYIATTNAEGIAELNVKIWLEGWDPAATNDVDGLNFEGNIGFMVRDKDEN